MKKDKQSVKRRIFMSNTYMVLLILSLFLVVNIVVIKLYEMSYKESLINATELADNTQELKALLNQWEPSTIEDEIQVFGSQLESYDAFLSIEVEGEIIYSNAEFSMDIFQKEIGQFLSEDDQIHVYVENYMTLITKYDETKKLRVYVLTGDNREFWAQRNNYSDLLIIILIDGIICIGLLLIVSRLFTKKLIRHILKPLDALSQGAKRMEDGNLSTPVSYKGDLEFEKVCHVFNQMQARTKEVNEEKEAYEKARIDMVAGISHDLRTPLTAIRASIKGIQDGIARTPETREKFLEVAYRRTLDLDHLLERLFYFSKLETGNMPLKLEATNWKNYLEDYVKAYISDNIKTSKSVHEDMSFSIKLSQVQEGIVSNIDQQQFKRILDNLLENSKKYSETEKVEVEIKTIIKQSSIILEVSDNGVGVPEPMLSRIFEQFYRVDESRHEQEGNGLGLYIVKYLVEKMEGSVIGENRNGFVVKIRLPII